MGILTLLPGSDSIFMETGAVPQGAPWVTSLRLALAKEHSIEVVIAQPQE